MRARDPAARLPWRLGRWRAQFDAMSDLKRRSAAPDPGTRRPDELTAPRATVRAPTAAPLEDKGQHPVWAIVSTLLLGGFIWMRQRQLGHRRGGPVVGLFVHEYGHVLAMNRFGMGPARIYIVPVPRRHWPRVSAWPSSEWHGVLGVAGGPGLRPAGGHAALLRPVFRDRRARPGCRAPAVIAAINLVNLAARPAAGRVAGRSARCWPASIRCWSMAAMVAIGGAGRLVGPVDAAAASSAAFLGLAAGRPSAPRRLARARGAALIVARGGLQRRPVRR